jgi:hypothetical protein
VGFRGKEFPPLFVLHLWVLKGGERKKDEPISAIEIEMYP